MVSPAYGNGSELHGVVLGAQRGGGQQKPQNLRVGLRSPAGREIEQRKDQYAAEQTSEQVERRGTEAHGEKEQLPLRAENGKWTGKRPLHRIRASVVSHGVFSLPPGLTETAKREN